jgi:cell shape-determining protein MreC
MKKTAQNDITGAWLVSKPNNEMFEKNWDLIFGKKKALEKSIKENNELYQQLAEYELDKSTGEVVKKDTND